jgi:5,10-methenyltetrahydromethanopterin hydrogenase
MEKMEKMAFLIPTRHFFLIAQKIGEKSKSIIHYHLTTISEVKKMGMVANCKQSIITNGSVLSFV